MNKKEDDDSRKRNATQRNKITNIIHFYRSICKLIDVHNYTHILLMSMTDHDLIQVRLILTVSLSKIMNSVRRPLNYILSRVFRYSLLVLLPYFLVCVFLFFICITFWSSSSSWFSCCWISFDFGGAVILAGLADWIRIYN